jgi:hypothetical protein
MVSAGEAPVQLVLVSNAHVNSAEDFEELAGWVKEADDTVRVRIAIDTREAQALEWTLPTLVVSFSPLRQLRAPRGVTLQGRLLPKSEEYRRLAAHGIAVPRWVRLVEGAEACLEHWGEYVVTKPDFGARGADVRIRRAGRVAWRAPRTLQALQLGGHSNAMVAQEFIYTGRWPVSFRVTSLLGEVVWATRIAASRERPPLEGPQMFSSGGHSVVSSGRGCHFSLCDDVAVIALGRAAHAAFPDVPLLGVDVVRDATTGALFVLEANSFGFAWHFSSARGLAMQREFALDLDAQFDGRRRAAARLARACRELAT